MKDISIELLQNLQKIHTTFLGLERIKRNLNLENEDVVEYCKNLINSKNCKITLIGKNYYCKTNNIEITIHSKSFTIITAHYKSL